MIRRVGIITIGDEVLQGRVLDKNKANLGQYFAGKGYEIVLQISPPDEESAIEKAIAYTMELADLLVITGGLGETKDDLTYSVTRGMLPEYELEIIVNHVGAASGYHLKKQNKSIILLPGPPSENVPMLRSLDSLFHEEAHFEKLYHLTGIGEYALEQSFDQLFGEDARHLVTYVSTGFVSLKIFSRDPDQVEAISAKVEDVFGEYIFYQGKLDLEEKIFSMLIQKNLRLSCVESATAGSILHSLTKISGSSQRIYGGFVVYQEASKEELLGLSKAFLEKYTTVSKETSEALAKSARNITKTELCLALTGYAEHQEESLRGQCYVSIATPWGTKNFHRKVGSWRRASSRNAMRVFALSCLWKVLAEA